MVSKIPHKIFSVTLALLVLMSTLSFTVEKHFCGDVLVDVSVFTETQKCGMESYEMEQASITKKHCCKDEIEIIKGQDKLKVSSFNDLKLQQQLFFTAFTYSYLNLFESLPLQNIPHKNYSPPNLVYDIQVLDQVYLI